MVPGQQARITAFRNGEIDLFTTGLSPEEQAAIEGTNPDAVWRDDLSAGLGQIGMNPEREPFDDVRVRRAVSLRDERTELIRDIQRYIMTEVAKPVQTWATPVRLPQLPAVKGYDPHASYGYYTMKQVWLDR